MTKKNTVFIETYDLSITARKDDKFGRVITNKSLKEEDIIMLYYYISENEDDFSPEEKVALFNLLSELDQKLLDEDGEE